MACLGGDFGSRVEVMGGQRIEGTDEGGWHYYSLHDGWWHAKDYGQDVWFRVEGETITIISQAEAEASVAAQTKAALHKACVASDGPADIDSFLA